jgi:hypothetical protein
MEYEKRFRGQHAGEEFDRRLTSVYKAILLYVMALDEYLQQRGAGLFSKFLISGFDKSDYVRTLWTCIY